MKQTRFLLAALLLMVCGMVCHAQKVVVHKKDGTKVEYKASDVKDVKYKKAYYYYAGWTCPTNEEELATLAVEPNGGIVDMSKTYSKSNPIRDLCTSEKLTNSVRDYYYIVVPNGHGIYDDDGDVTTQQYEKVTDVTIPNHTIWKSSATNRNIDGIYIY